MPQIDKDTPILTVAELKRLLTVLTSLFDVARIVNPYDTAVLSIKDDGRVEGNPYTCFKVWGKHQRCANCTSREAGISHCRKDKYEYVKNSIFYVVSNPIAYRDDKGDVHPVVLEIVSHVSDHLAGGRFGRRSIIDIIDEDQKKIYSDELTGAYNRRYLFEKIINSNHSNDFTLIMVDVHRFKEINDKFGHAVGDKVLMAVTKNLRESVREGDYVVRYGGDEFLVILNHCGESRAKQAVPRIRAGLSHVKVEGCDDTVSCDVGYVTTDVFDGTENSFMALLDAADKAMYEEKRLHYTQEGIQTPW